LKKKEKKRIISIVIPTFNEQNNVSNIINQLLSLDIVYEIEIIVVDDNSYDGTAKLVREYGRLDKRVRLISRLGRSGLSSAIKEGCLCASGDIIAVMDADGQHDPTYIELALRKIELKKVDIILGSRFMKGSIIKGLSKERKNSSSIANNLARLSLYGSYDYLTDYMSGFFVFKRNACIELIEKIDVHGFKFLYELLAISKGKFKILEIPLIFNERMYGNSKLDLAVVWDFVISLLHSFCGRIFPRRAVSFALVGSTGVFIQLSTIYFLLAVTNFDFETVLPVGVIIAASSNFIINNILTFRSNKLLGKSFYTGLLKFLLVSSLPIIANVGVTNLFYSKFSTNTFFSQLLGIFVVFIWNYAASSKVVWNN
jgi:dolichol-phosphate mannosyltransferase